MLIIVASRPALDLGELGAARYHEVPVVDPAFGAQAARPGQQFRAGHFPARRFGIAANSRPSRFIAARLAGWARSQTAWHAADVADGRRPCRS